MCHFYFAMLINPFVQSLTRQLTQKVVSSSSNFWINIYFNLLPLRRCLLSCMLNPADFTGVFLRLIQVSLQIPFNCIHLLRGITESGNQEWEGTLIIIRVEICLCSRAKVYRSCQVSRHAGALFSTRKFCNYSRIFPGKWASCLST